MRPLAPESARERSPKLRAFTGVDKTVPHVRFWLRLLKNSDLSQPLPGAVWCSPGFCFELLLIIQAATGMGGGLGQKRERSGDSPANPFSNAIEDFKRRALAGFHSAFHAVIDLGGVGPTEMNPSMGCCQHVFEVGELTRSPGYEVCAAGKLI